jgi:MFS family permease
VLLRILQGFGVGGEWGGAVLMAVEHSPAHRRGFYGSWPQLGVPAGLLLATGLFALVSQLPREEFLSWGWRIPFLISIGLVGIGLVIRIRLLETPSFQRLQQSGGVARQPILEVIARHPRELLVAMGTRIAENGAFYIYSVFVLVYATESVGMQRSTVLNGILLGALAELVALPIFGILSDRVGRRPIYLFGAVSTALFAFPLFWMLDTGSTPSVWFALVIAFGVTHAAMYAPQAAFMSEMFSARVRYSGASLGAQLASVLAGGLSPFIATALLQEFGRGEPIAAYLAVMAVITCISVVVAGETARKEMRG